MNDNSNRTRQSHNVPIGIGPANVGVLELQIDEERIARRAYEIYESRHRVDGHADEDWFQAASEYAARLESTSRLNRASSSFGERVRSARR